MSAINFISTLSTGIEGHALQRFQNDPIMKDRLNTQSHKSKKGNIAKSSNN